MAWSDAARAAALETRRAHMKAKKIGETRAPGHVGITATKQWNAGRSFTSYSNSKGQAMFMDNGVLRTSRAIRDRAKRTK